jgi:hypothetical protein
MRIVVAMFNRVTYDATCLSVKNIFLKPSLSKGFKKMLSEPIGILQ